MTEPLSAETLVRMRAEHVVCTMCPENPHCQICFDDACIPYAFPCSTALLLAELDRRQDECIDCFAKYATDPGVQP